VAHVFGQLPQHAHHRSEVGSTPRCPWGGFLKTDPGYLSGDPPWAFPGVGWLSWVGGGSSSEYPGGWSTPWLGITEPPGAFRRNYGKLRGLCVSFVITKKKSLRKSGVSSKCSLWVRERLPLKPPVGAYSAPSLSSSSSSSSSYSSSSLASEPTRRTSGVCSAWLIML
jgi:hypothetical protein